MNTENGSKKIKIKFACTLLVVIVIAVFLSGLVWFVSEKAKATSEKDAYYSTSSSDIETLFEISNNPTLMFDVKAYNKFEDNCLGNENSVLLSFGTYCQKDNLICKSNEKTILTVDDKDIIISNKPASYINIMDNCVYYRDDATRGIYKYSISDNKSELIVSKVCGEFIVSKKGISYIDITSSTLNYMSFESMKSSPVFDEPISSFAIIGNSYYCLKKNKDFGIIGEDGLFHCIVSDVDRFFCDGNIVIQKASNIYTINDIGSFKYQLIDIKGVVVGIYDDKIFVNENQCINMYNAETCIVEKTVMELEKDEILKSFYVLKDSYEIVSYKNTDDIYA